MLKLVGAAMAMLGFASTQVASGPAAPIYLSAEPVEGGMRIQVIGAPATDYQASFQLEVSSPSGSSQHRSTANLRAGDHATLSTVTVGVPKDGIWRARLRVEPSGAEAYEQVTESASH